MLILKDRKRQEIKDVFPTVNDLISYVGSENDKININNRVIIESFNSLYNRMVNDEGVIKFSRFSRWYPKELGFKKKNILQEEFWLERGWSKEETKNFISTIMVERVNKSNKTKEERKNTININGLEKYKYKTVEFESEQQPICKCCGSKLSLVKVNIQNKVDNYFYSIEGCSNDDCETYNMSKTNKYKSYLPTNIANNKLNELSKIINESNRLCVDYWVNKGLKLDEANIEISKIQRENSKQVRNRFIVSKDNLKKRGFSEDEIRKICLTPSSIEFWVNKGYSKDEAKLMVLENQSNASQHVDYGKRLLPSNIEYWVGKGYNYTQAKKRVSEHQRTFSKEICIDKYGEEEGLKRFNERQEKWLRNYTRNSYSKISQELFWGLIESNKLEDNEIYFATYQHGILDNSGKNHEYRLKLNQSFILPDFFVKDLNKIIEFDGTYYHRPTPENLLRESNRDKNIIQSGYEVLHVSESDYKKDKQKVINKCIEFLSK